MATTRPQKKPQKTTAKSKTKAQALPVSGFKSLSLKSRIGMVVILASLILGAVYLSLTRGSSTSFGTPGSDLELEFDYSWIEKDPTAPAAKPSSSYNFTPRFRVKANKSVDAWRLVTTEHYTGDCNANAFQQAGDQILRAPARDDSLPSFFLQANYEKNYLEHSLRTDDDSKRHCYEAVAEDENGNIKRAYLFSPVIAPSERP